MEMTIPSTQAFVSKHHFLLKESGVLGKIADFRALIGKAKDKPGTSGSAITKDIIKKEKKRPLSKGNRSQFVETPTG